MDNCDSLCPNKQTIQNTAKSTRGLNLGLRFVGSQNPNPNAGLASSHVSLNFMSLAFLMLLLMLMKLANILTVSLVSFLL